MKFLKAIFNKFKKDERGITGTDVAAAIIIIALTMGVVTSIYINTINKYKDNVRYSNATRIATSIMEKIESTPFIEVINTCRTLQDDGTYTNEKTVTNSSIFGVKVQAGYTAIVSTTKVNDIDIARDVKVEVSYKSTIQTKTITLYGVKELELLNEVNAPDISLISDYSKYLSGEINYYPVISTGGQYVITDYSDSNWYNYSEKKLALIYSTKDALEVGATFTTVNGTIYEWIPRFGLDGDNVVFCYGTSKYKIAWSGYVSNGKKIFGYMIARDNSNNIINVTKWLDNTFAEGDGLTRNVECVR